MPRVIVAMLAAASRSPTAIDCWISARPCKCIRIAAKVLRLSSGGH
jgi:hypothetical protein